MVSANVSNPFGTSAVKLYDSINIDLAPTKFTVTNTNSDPILLGTYLVNYSVTGLGVVVADPTITYVNCSALTVYKGNTVTKVSDDSSANSTYMITFMFEYTDETTDPVIVFSGGTLPASITSGDLVVVKIN